MYCTHSRKDMMNSTQSRSSIYRWVCVQTNVRGGLANRPIDTHGSGVEPQCISTFRHGGCQPAKPLWRWLPLYVRSKQSPLSAPRSQACAAQLWITCADPMRSGAPAHLTYYTCASPQESLLTELLRPSINPARVLRYGILSIRPLVAFPEKGKNSRMKERS